MSVVVHESLFDEIPEEQTERYRSLDSVRLYQGEISSIPLMDPVTANQLAQIIQDGKKAKADLELIDFLEIPREEEVLQVVNRVEAGVEAHRGLVEGNLRLVPHVARLTLGILPYKDPIKPNGESAFKGAIFKDLREFAGAPLSLADRIQAGNEGLLKAADNYRPGKALFSTYAWYWVEQAIARAVMLDRNIHVPLNVQAELSNWRKTNRGEANFLTAQDISSLPFREQYEAIRDLEERQKFRELGAMVAGTALLEEVDEKYLVDNDPSLYDQVEPVLDAEAVQTALATLPEREKFILEMRFGVADDRTHTLEEIGHFLDLTRESVRRLEGQALARLGGSAILRAQVLELTSPRQRVKTETFRDFLEAERAERAVESRIQNTESNLENLINHVLEPAERLERTLELEAGLPALRYQLACRKLVRVISGQVANLVEEDYTIVDKSGLPSVYYESLIRFLSETCSNSTRAQVIHALAHRFDRKYGQLRYASMPVRGSNSFYRWLKAEIAKTEGQLIEVGVIAEAPKSI